MKKNSSIIAMQRAQYEQSLKQCAEAGAESFNSDVALMDFDDVEEAARIGEDLGEFDEYINNRPFPYVNYIFKGLSDESFYYEKYKHFLKTDSSGDLTKKAAAWYYGWCTAALDHYNQVVA